MVVIIRCGKCKYTGPALEHAEMARYECMKCGQVNEITNIPLKEWLGFTYTKYIPHILSAIDEDKFEQLLGATKAEIKRGKLSSSQINKLKGVLKNGFEQGQTIREITNNINKEVKVKDLKVMKNNKPLYVIPAKRRNLSIARTETTRMANEGSARFYKESGIKKYSWIATFGERTCPECEGLNGQTWVLGQGPQPPAHTLCRCTIVPEVDLI